MEDHTEKKMMIIFFGWLLQLFYIHVARPHTAHLIKNRLPGSHLNYYFLLNSIGGRISIFFSFPAFIFLSLDPGNYTTAYIEY
jgi:hypothetical protein